jgi:hypothetical protein
LRVVHAQPLDLVEERLGAGAREAVAPDEGREDEDLAGVARDDRVDDGLARLGLRELVTGDREVVEAGDRLEPGTREVRV